MKKLRTLCLNSSSSTTPRRLQQPWKIKQAWTHVVQKGITSQSSRIDLIYQCLIYTLRINNLHTIFDHTILTATLSIKIQPCATHERPHHRVRWSFNESNRTNRTTCCTTSPPENLPPKGNEQNLNEDDQRHVQLVKTETFSTPLQDKPLYILSTQW